jgi:short-subunit dehydrogenase
MREAVRSPGWEEFRPQFGGLLEINLVAPFVLPRTLGVKMLVRHRGAIVTVASISGLVGITDRAAYNAS